ncbi:MAG: MAPEG family protein [Bdellovibrionales bacterium]
MEKQILFPMIFYVFYIWCLALLNFRTRLGAIKSKKMPMQFFKSYQGDASERVVVVGRHYDHQFELPTVFLILCVAHFAMKNVDQITLILAWLFVASRLGHSFEHLGKNRIMKRVRWFATGWLMILGLAGQLFYFALN